MKASENLQSKQLSNSSLRGEDGVRSKHEKQHVTLPKNTVILREIHWKTILLPQASLACIQFLQNYS